MVILRILQALCGLSNLIYLTGWVIALIGLALLQHKCRDGPDEYEGFATALMAPVAGNKCKKLFRFPWFVWALSTLPLLLSLVHNIKPKLVARGTGSLFAILAVLHILMANEFYNMNELSSGQGKAPTYAQVALAGFAIMAAAAMLTCIFEAVMDPNRDKGTGAPGTGGRDSSRDLEKGRGTRGGPIANQENRPVAV